MKIEYFCHAPIIAVQARRFNLDPVTQNKMAKFPETMRKFPFVTEHALTVLLNDRFLLARLEEHFKNSRVLSWDLGRTLASRKLLDHKFFSPPRIYGLCGSSDKDQAVYKKMMNEVMNSPTFDTVALIFATEKISFDADVKLAQEQAMNIMRSLNKVHVEFLPIGLQIIYDCGTTAVKITKGLALPAIHTMSSGEMFISEKLLNDPNELSTTFIAALKLPL